MVMEQDRHDMEWSGTAVLVSKMAGESVAGHREIIWKKAWTGLWAAGHNRVIEQEGWASGYEARRVNFFSQMRLSKVQSGFLCLFVHIPLPGA